MGRRRHPDGIRRARASRLVTQLAYLWGEDAWAIDHAAASATTDLAEPGMPPLTVWRVSLDDDTDASGGDSVARRRARLLDEVAARLGMSQRSLHRKLEEDGTTFRRLLSDVRSAHL